MKKLRIIISLLICCLLIDTPCQAVTKQVKFKVEVTYRILKGEKITLYVKGHKKSKKVKWKSSNKKIASVSKKGVVTGKKGGTCKITAKIGKKKYKSEIFVFTGENIKYEYDVNPEDLVNRYDIVDVTEINQENKTLCVGQTFPLKITGTKKKITWKSSDPNIADVSSSGTVTAKSEGKAIITASFKDSSYIYEHTCEITVLPEWADAETIEKNYGAEFLYPGNFIYISAAHSSSLSGLRKSVSITNIPEIMEVETIYGNDVRYKYNGTNILFNLNDLSNLGLLD